MTRLCVILTLLAFLSQKSVHSDVLQKNQICPTISSSFYSVEWPSTENLTLSNPPCINQNKELLYRKCLNGVWGLEPECEYVKKIIPPKCPLCHIFNSFNTNLEVIRHESRQVEFVAILRLVYSKIVQHLNYEKFYEFIQNEIYKKLSVINYLKQFYTFTIMKIIDRDETKREVLVNIHLTSKKLSSNYEEEFQKVEQFLRMSQVDLVNFLSTRFCMSETKIVFWPTTLAGSESVSTQYCFKPNGSPLTRMCEGNAIDGVQWADINETCEIPRTSSVTQELLELVETAKPTSLSNFFYFHHFNPFDVFLFGKLLQKVLEHISDTNHFVDTYFRIICNLLDIDRDIWIEAQYKMKATDIILDAINSFFQKYNGGKTLCNKDYLYIQSIPIRQLGGFAMMKNHDPCDDGIIILPSGKVSKVQYDIRECFVFVQLFPEQISQLGNNTNAVIFIFFKDSLFSEKLFFTERYLHSKVMRVMFQNFTDSQKLDGAIFFSHNVDTGSSTNCSSWSYSNEKRGSWENVEGGGRTNNSIQICQFEHAFYFALTESIEKNVTDSLMEILEANITVQETISILQNISKRYQEFVPLDVFLVGKILEKVHEDKEIDLESLTHTICNLHLIQEKVLQESQVKKKATDRILYFLDKILINQNYKSQVQTVSDHFRIVVNDIKETNFSGVALLKENNTIQTKILEGDINVEEVSNFKNLESALIFSSKLKEQLEDAKIIVTHFSNDALFVEQDKSSKNVKRVFGVILPEINNYSGPILMLQKISKNGSQKQCAHWKYNRNFSGIWLKDQAGKELSSLIECEFWHTTHFALLLLDENKYNDQIFLDWITYLNCILSLLGLFCIFFTAIFFKKWRQSNGNKILLNFALAITLQIVLFHISSVVDRNSDYFLLCTIIGTLLHYSVISEFCWMAIIAYLQYIRFVKILGGPPQHILLKSCLLGWLLPLLPVILVLTFGGYKNFTSNIGLCYPSGLGLFLGVWLPVSVAIFVNFAMFASIVYSVCHKKTECGSVDGNDSFFQWKLAFLLFFMLGMSWIFGFLSELNFGIIFVYLFSVTATLQGFVVFWFFIVLNSSTKNMYLHNVRKYCRKDY